ncbi:hypothetical protein [Anabaena subtropica]|uniref:Uncharacterized protein n=1 Tax=Anabaena subtropica FACHB-260 TaxID=2692884 RepID=A0ABR8CVB3_9NOST|nr:hypothetical protein [Anabaena subtropica]MBD2345720.1 hypothetical protein [Anabaena subtropica FACHB-260]
MANRSRKLTPKSSSQNQSDVGAKKPRLKQKQVGSTNLKKEGGGSIDKTQTQKAISPSKSYKLSSIIAIAILLTGASLVLSATWIGFMLIFKPEQVVWLNNFLPEWAHIPFDHSENPQTIPQIQVSLSQKQQISGETIPLDDEEKSFVLPVLRQRPNCLSNCKEVIELRVYQLENLQYSAQPEKFYRLANSLPITGPEESFAIAPLVDTTSENPDVTNPLPLSEVHRFEAGTPAAGVWLNLRGYRQQENYAIAYGQIVYYNPERTNLQPMLSWTSPSGHIPKWEQVTGSKAKELVIDQTISLEPRLQVYQVKSVNIYLNPIQLEEISLQNPVLKDSSYKSVLLFSRNGLWSPAFEWLTSIKKQRKNSLPAAAQAQLDLIRLHSQITKAQAEKTWASPSQQVLADLIDGRWEKALQVFSASPQNAQEVAILLKADKGRLWRRVVAATQVNPNRTAVQAWGALILTVQQGETKANSWLREQPKISTANLRYIQSLTKQLNPQIDTIDDSESQPDTDD